MRDPEKQLVERAKKALMTYLSMSEPEAHRFLEKQAMDLRVKKTEVARAVLGMYEN